MSCDEIYTEICFLLYRIRCNEEYIMMLKSGCYTIEINKKEGFNLIGNNLDEFKPEMIAFLVEKIENKQKLLSETIDKLKIEMEIQDKNE